MQIVGLANKPSLPILGINYFIDSFLVILAALSSSLRYFFELASNHFSLSPNTPHPHRITLITMTFQPELLHVHKITEKLAHRLRLLLGRPFELVIGLLRDPELDVMRK